MAVLTLTAATWSACSNNDALAVTEEPVQPRTFTVTTTLSQRDGAATRSTMTDNGDGSISAEWKENDQLSVYYYVSPSGTAETTATVTAVNPTTKAATITFTLTNPLDGGCISFRYPLSYWDGSKSPGNQLGTLADINANHAAISGMGLMTVSGTDVTLPDVTMTPEMCIWKFSFTDGTDDITSAITKLVINFPENYMTYTITPATSLYTIYVAMYGDYPFTDEPMSITAQTATEVYHKSVASVTLDAGKTYTTTGLALSKAQVGKVFGADGNIYANAGAATDAGTTAVAMICYVGAAGSADSSTGSEAYMGLALALSNASTGKLCDQHSATCLTTQYLNDQQTNDMAGIANTDYLIDHDPDGHGHAAANAARSYNSGTHPTGTSEWFLPSAGQWDKMVNACKNVLGSNNDHKDLRDGFSARGGTNLLQDYYWTSTENTASKAFRYNFGGGYIWNIDYKYLNSCVRPAFAF